MTTTEVIPFQARDGHPLTLVHVMGDAAPSKGPVLLVHGAGVRAELFRPPLPRTLPTVLTEQGWDVWMLNWRASIDLEPTAWTLDTAAVHDHPAAVDEVVTRTGADSVKAVVHCQGSTSFTMAAVSGLLPQVDTVVSNAVSLHPVVPRLSTFKLGRVVPLVNRLMPAVSPAWGDDPKGFWQHAIVGFVRATHHECDNTVCKMVSFVYGFGWPALWSHENLDEATHEWIRGEFGLVPLSFFRQMDRCVRAGHLVPVTDLPGLPESLVAQPPQTDARFAFLAGEDNKCFLPQSQQRTYEFFDRHRPGRDTLHRIKGYGHLDVLFGKSAYRDTYPLITEELSR